MHATTNAPDDKIPERIVGQKDGSILSTYGTQKKFTLGYLFMLAWQP
jgi:hypothetical protein